MIAPQPYTIWRSTDQWVLGGVQSTTTPIQAFGPVQQASMKEIQMLPEADRVEGVRSFWWTQPLYPTRGTAPVPSTHGEVPTAISDTVFTLSSLPPEDTAVVYSNGLLQIPGIDYILSGTTLTFTTAPTLPYITWPITALVGQSASDILQYGSEQYRVISTYKDPGGGYWKALAETNGRRLMPTSTSYPNGQVLVSTALTVDQINKIIQPLTCGMIGVNPADFSVVRVDWQSEGHHSSPARRTTSASSVASRRTWTIASCEIEHSAAPARLSRLGSTHAAGASNGCCTAPTAPIGRACFTPRSSWTSSMTN